jgi:hypothetical protein
MSSDSEGVTGPELLRKILGTLAELSEQIEHFGGNGLTHGAVVDRAERVAYLARLGALALLPGRTCGGIAVDGMISFAAALPVIFKAQ